MKLIGYLVLTAGFLGGALSTVVDAEEVRWVYYGLGAVAAVVGVGLIRAAGVMHRTRGDMTESNMAAVQSSLAKVAANIAKLDDEKESINTYDVRHRIDELFADDLVTFVEARESISHVYGLQAYADVMSSFAAGERYLNRVWSASADGYIDEVNTYLTRAREQFSHSLDAVEGLAGKA